MSTTLTVRLSDNLAKELASLAETTERPKSYFIQKALENYLNEQAELQIALDRMRDINDPVISSDEMRKEIGI
jgi:RHH-type rel operon transcriptional repressor/antitoxin RelB